MDGTERTRGRLGVAVVYKASEGVSEDSGLGHGHDCAIGIVDNDKFALAALCGCLRNTPHSLAESRT